MKYRRALLPVGLALSVLFGLMAELYARAPLSWKAGDYAGPLYAFVVLPIFLLTYGPFSSGTFFRAILTGLLLGIAPAIPLVMMGSDEYISVAIIIGAIGASAGCAGWLFYRYLPASRSALLLFSLQGRSGRLPFAIAFVALYGARWGIAIGTYPRSDYSSREILPILVYGVLSVAAAFLIVKRCHDLDKSGKHFWLCLVPFYNIYWMGLLLLKKGTRGPNRFGAEPGSSGNEQPLAPPSQV